MGTDERAISRTKKEKKILTFTLSFFILLFIHLHCAAYKRRREKNENTTDLNTNRSDGTQINLIFGKFMHRVR